MKFVSVVFILIMHMASVAMPPPGEHGQICVKSIDKLSCYYRYESTTGEKVRVPLKLDKEIYYKMAYTCTAVKILNGYLLGKGNIEDDISKSSYTPDATNVLVPHLGLIQKEGTEFKYVTKTWIVKPGDKEKCLVFVSGNSGAAPQHLSEAYNYFFNSSMSLGEIEVVNNPKGQSKHGNQGHTEEALLDHLVDKKFPTSCCAIIINMFSWLDPCHDCMDQISDFLTKKEQKLPITFRIISQRKYKELVPFDLSKAYDGSSLCFQDLYKKRASLVTRIDPNIDRIRDLVIENLQTGIITLALQKEVSFWGNVQHFIMKLALEGTSQSANVWTIFEQRFPIDCLLIRANDILRSEKNKICYQCIEIITPQLLDLFDKLKSATVSDDAPCPLFLRYFRFQTDFHKSGTALQWKKVLQGGIALSFARLELTPSIKNEYINDYLETCLLYDKKTMSWDTLTLDSVVTSFTFPREPSIELI